ncbi:MAG: DUF5348 domain-containing protein [Clostridium chrysemydis]|uniref:DUF5348 domain-containing protein n=1 Tax=Clostridium chrysemydis TaxID=2665504 RepID=UPI003F390534
MKEGKLFYNEDNDRIGIIDNMDLWVEDGFHCGDGLEVKINDEWVPESIEMDRKGIWYLVNSKLNGSELEGVIARIK